MTPNTNYDLIHKQNNHYHHTIHDLEYTMILKIFNLQFSDLNVYYVNWKMSDKLISDQSHLVVRGTDWKIMSNLIMNHEILNHQPDLNYLVLSPYHKIILVP
jgi:hypothetical protein